MSLMINKLTALEIMRGGRVFWKIINVDVKMNRLLRQKKMLNLVVDLMIQI